MAGPDKDGVSRSDGDPWRFMAIRHMKFRFSIARHTSVLINMPSSLMVCES
jgi:hypothetical protein